MIDTDKYESMRQLFLDFIDSASDEVDEGAWKNKLTMLDDLLAEVMRLRKQLSKAKNWVRDYLTDINGNYQSYENRVLHDDFRQQMGDEEE